MFSQDSFLMIPFRIDDEYLAAILGYGNTLRKASDETVEPSCRTWFISKLLARSYKPLTSTALLRRFRTVSRA